MKWTSFLSYFPNVVVEAQAAFSCSVSNDFTFYLHCICIVLRCQDLLGSFPRVHTELLVSLPGCTSYSSSIAIIPCTVKSSHGAGGAMWQLAGTLGLSGTQMLHSNLNLGLSSGLGVPIQVQHLSWIRGLLGPTSPPNPGVAR